MTELLSSLTKPCFLLFHSNVFCPMGVTDASFTVKDKEASDVGKFLNRILGLSVERQNLVSTKIQITKTF